MSNTLYTWSPITSRPYNSYLVNQGFLSVLSSSYLVDGIKLVNPMAGFLYYLSGESEKLGNSF